MDNSNQYGKNWIGVWRRRILLFFALAIPAFLLTFCIGGPGYYSSKYAGAQTTAAHGPRTFAAELIPERQTEPHTCGFHALSSIYKAYGLDPEEHRLRFRLGVDKPVNLLFPESRGTVHPDILRVLSQDGFKATIADPGETGAADQLKSHLDDGHVALALTKVNTYHWVALTHARDFDQDSVEVCDSLQEHNYQENLQEYLADQTYSLILIKTR